MTISSTNQLTQLESDIRQNVKQFPNQDHFDEIWKELSTLKANDGANFQQDLVQLNQDLHNQCLLPGLEIVDGLTQSPQGFAVVDTAKLESDIKQASMNPNANMESIWQTLAAVEQSEDPAAFQQFLQKINQEITGNRQIVQTGPFQFDWQPDSTDPASGSSGSSSSGSSGQSETSWVNPNGTSDGGGSSGGTSSGGRGGGYSGGGYSGGGGDAGSTSGGGDASTTDSPSSPGPLGNGASDATGAQVVGAAESQIGVPYVFDTANPGKDFDCSGLTMWAWKQAGVDLPHNAAAQYNDTAHVEHVPLSQIQPGDLLFYNDGGKIHHVAMYVGNGKMVEAPAPGKRVQEVPLRTTGLMPMAGRPHN